MITSVDTYIPARNIQIALAKGYDPELQFNKTIGAAKFGDVDAINILYYNCRHVIGKAMFKFFGQRQYWKTRIAAGDDYLFLAEMYALFLKSAKNGNRFLWTFKPDMYPGSELQHFRGYLLKVAMALGMQLNKQRASNGVTSVGKDKISYTSIDSDEGIDIADRADDTQARIEIQEYLQYLKQHHPQGAIVVEGKMRGLSLSEIGEQLNVKETRVRIILRNMKQVYEEFSGHIISSEARS